MAYMLFTFNEMSMGCLSWPEIHSSALSEGQALAVGGNISSWNISDLKNTKCCFLRSQENKSQLNLYNWKQKRNINKTPTSFILFWCCDCVMDRYVLENM